MVADLEFESSEGTDEIDGPGLAAAPPCGPDGGGRVVDGVACSDGGVKGHAEVAVTSISGFVPCWIPLNPEAPDLLHGSSRWNSR